MAMTMAMVAKVLVSVCAGDDNGCVCAGGGNDRGTVLATTMVIAPTPVAPVGGQARRDAANVLVVTLEVSRMRHLGATRL